MFVELLDIMTRPVTAAHFICLNEALLEGEYRLVQTLVDHKCTPVKMFIVEQQLALGVVVLIKQSSSSTASHQREDHQDQRMMSPTEVE